MNEIANKITEKIFDYVSEHLDDTIRNEVEYENPEVSGDDSTISDDHI